MIFHVTDNERWAQSQAAGQHTGSSRNLELADEGFIHCSTADQLRGVLERFYVGVPGLLVLHIDEQLLDVPLVYENVADAPAPFPHLYGPLNLSAVVDVQPIVAPSASKVAE